MHTSLKRGAAVVVMTGTTMALGAFGLGATAAHADVIGTIQKTADGAYDPCPQGYKGVIVGTKPGDPDSYYYACVKL